MDFDPRAPSADYARVEALADRCGCKALLARDVLELKERAEASPLRMGMTVDEALGKPLDELLALRSPGNEAEATVAGHHVTYSLDVYTCGRRTYHMAHSLRPLRCWTVRDQVIFTWILGLLGVPDDPGTRIYPGSRPHILHVDWKVASS